jgi:glycosyltransferase involved in cell wall biosynthesis
VLDLVDGTDEREGLEIMSSLPRVCIGMPIYNGQRFMVQALDSILSQTFTDFELVISDNASTDQTSDICRAYAAKDKRIKYNRLENNIGAILNYERSYQLGGGQYFKWAAHDDIIEPTFIARCVEVLDANPSAVLAYPKAKFIDADGNFYKEYKVKLGTDALSPAARFHAILMAHHKNTHNLEIFGLMRRSAVDLIPQQGRHAASDRVFLARLALYGPFIEIPEVLFLSREHSGQSIHTLPKYMQENRSLLSRFVGVGQLPPTEWFDPKYTDKMTFPEWRLMKEYMVSTKYGWLSTRDRALCFASIMRRQLSHGNWARMVRDFVLAGDKLMANVIQSFHEPKKAAEPMTKETIDHPAPKAAA